MDGCQQSTPTADETASAIARRRASGVPRDPDLPIPKRELHRGAPKDGIPAIVDPSFGPDWDAVGEGDGTGHPDLSLAAEDEVIGVERAGTARAYPLRILNRHEVVNDDLGGPLLVTFCPLCGSGVTAERRVNGDETTFGVSGYLWHSDLVMYDELTGSLWSQILGRAINGPETGESLTFVPSTRTTWGEWSDSHPDTEVLLPPPRSGTVLGRASLDYTTNPYAGYEVTERIGIGYNEFDDDRLHPKTMVVGITHEGVVRAYPLPEVGTNATVNDQVGGLPVVVTSTGVGSLYAYERRLSEADTTLEFENTGPRHLRGGGSRWEKVTGRAVDGPYAGTTLTRANDRSQLFWFAWADFNPETEIYGNCPG